MRNRTRCGMNGKFFFLCLLWAVLGLGGCAARQTAVPESVYGEGQLVLPGGKPASDRDFLKLSANADYILIGERHDSRLDHMVQARLLELLAKEGRRPLLGLEMLPRNRYDATLASFVSGRIGIQELPLALDWRTTWGYDFSLYRPVFLVAKQYQLPVYGLNISAELRRSVSRKGLAGLSKAEKRQLPAIVSPLQEQREKLAVFFRKHHAMLAAAKAGTVPEKMGPSRGGGVVASQERGKSGPSTVNGKTGTPAGMSAAFERFLLVQSLWDSTMAATATAVRIEAGGRRPVVILAGGGHIEHGYGIASRLKFFDPGAHSLLVMPFSGNSPPAHAADIFFFSPESARHPPVASQAASAPGGQPGKGRLGIRLDSADGKVRVLAVGPSSRAARAGLMAGDIILRADGLHVGTAADLHKAALQAKRHSRRLMIALQRQKKVLEVTLPDPE